TLLGYLYRRYAWPRKAIRVPTTLRGIRQRRLHETDMTWTLSQRARKLTSSAIREILKVTERPEVISFAGGLPSPATFPVERVRWACSDILASNPSAALQYGPTEGYLPLREWVAERYSQNGVRVSVNQV